MLGLAFLVAANNCSSAAFSDPDVHHENTSSLPLAADPRCGDELATLAPRAASPTATIAVAIITCLRDIPPPPSVLPGCCRTLQWPRTANAARTRVGTTP